MIILSMLLLPRMNVMLDFICMGPIDLPGTRRKRQNKKRKIRAHIWTYNLDIFSPTALPTELPGF